MSASTSSHGPLATEASWEGDAGSTQAPGVGDGNDAGAAGDSSINSITISTAAMSAIIVVVILVILVGVSTATLFFIAKKREWTIRETIRRSTRKVATALTPRRSEFPRAVKGSMRLSHQGRSRRPDHVPPNPRLRPEDLEKGLPPSEVKAKVRIFGRK